MSHLLAAITDLEPIDADLGDAALPRLPVLERLLARGVRVPAAADWRRFVLAELGVDVADDELPIGATLALAAGLPAASGTWLLATPVHLQATLTDLRLHAAGPLPLVDAQAAALAARLTDACAEPGFALHAVGAQLLAQFADALEVRTVDPAPLAGRRLDRQLPQGRDGGRVRRRMTELQMLLHDTGDPAPVPVNALWLWGGAVRRSVRGAAGRRRTATIRSSPRCTVSTTDASTAATRGLVSWRLAALGGGGDAFAAAERRWFAPLAAALANGELESATVHVGARAYALRPWQRWRVWAPARPWWELAG